MCVWGGGLGQWRISLQNCCLSSLSKQAAIISELWSSSLLSSQPVPSSELKRTPLKPCLEKQSHFTHTENEGSCHHSKPPLDVCRSGMCCVAGNRYTPSLFTLAVLEVRFQISTATIYLLLQFLGLER